MQNWPAWKEHYLVVTFVLKTKSSFTSSTSLRLLSMTPPSSFVNRRWLGEPSKQRPQSDSETVTKRCRRTSRGTTNT